MVKIILKLIDPELIKTFFAAGGFILSVINFWFLFVKQRTNFDVKINEIVDSRVEFYIEFIFINKSNKPFSITGIETTSNNEKFEVVYHVENIMSRKYFDDNHKTHGLPINLSAYQTQKCYLQFMKNENDKTFDYKSLKFKIATSRKTKKFKISIGKDLLVELSDLYTK